MKLFSYENISIKVYDGVFYPTETSKMFIDFFKSEQDNYSDPNQSLLDLGCGSGVVSVSLKALGFQNSIFASDISESAKLNVIENSKINVKYPWNLNIGYDCWLGNEVWLDNTEMVTIGNDCCISQGTYIVTGNHNFKKESFDYSGKEVNIGAHSWIGAKSIICPGANIKVGSFIKVGSIVK